MDQATPDEHRQMLANARHEATALRVTERYGQLTRRIVVTGNRVDALEQNVVQAVDRMSTAIRGLMARLDAIEARFLHDDGR